MIIATRAVVPSGGRPTTIIKPYMSPEFKSLLSRHIGSAFAKQLAMADFLGDRNWGVILSEGRATFGDDLSFPIQLLGTEAEGDSSWLWAWANEASNLPPALLEASEELRRLGEDDGIQEFVEPCFSLELADGHLISMIASGMNPDCCYYRGPYDGGALFFLILEVPADVVGPVRAERASTVMTEMISSFDVDHWTMARSFLESQGFDVECGDALLTATRGKESLQVSFDSRDLIDRIEAKLQAQ